MGSMFESQADKRACSVKVYHIHVYIRGGSKGVGGGGIGGQNPPQAVTVLYKHNYVTCHIM